MRSGQVPGHKSRVTSQLQVSSRSTGQFQALFQVRGNKFQDPSRASGPGRVPPGAHEAAGEGSRPRSQSPVLATSGVAETTDRHVALLAPASLPPDGPATPVALARREAISSWKIEKKES